MTGARLTKPVVLVVDDDEGVRDALTLLLEEEHEVVLAEDGPRALQLFRSHPPDLVLLDIRMPGMSGLEVLARMKDGGSQVPVILVSVVNEVATAVQGMRLGAFDYLTKPWNESALLASIREGASRRGEPRGVLLIGDDLGPLAALQLALEDHILVTTAVPDATRLIALTNRPPALVIFDSGLDPEATAGFVRMLRGHFSRAALMVMMRDVQGAMRMPELAALAPRALIEKPSRLDAVLIRIAALLPSGGRPSGSWDFGPHALRAIGHLACHFHEPLSVVDVARAVGLSEDRLAHVFREALGISVKDYLERLRVTVGRRLLAETEVKIDEIARRCGLADASHFSRVFMSHARLRPGEYRRRSPVLRSG